MGYLFVIVRQFDHDDDVLEVDMDRTKRAIECFVDSDLRLLDQGDYQEAIKELYNFQCPKTELTTCNLR